MLILLLVGAGCLTAGYALLTAPTLFAELWLDGVLVAGLYRRLVASPPTDWLRTALRRSWLPFAATLVLLFVAGIILETMAPGASSMGAALTQWWAAR